MLPGPRTQPGKRTIGLSVRMGSLIQQRSIGGLLGPGVAQRSWGIRFNTWPSSVSHHPWPPLPASLHHGLAPALVSCSACWCTVPAGLPSGLHPHLAARLHPLTSVHLVESCQPGVRPWASACVGITPESRPHKLPVGI